MLQEQKWYFDKHKKLVITEWPVVTNCCNVCLFVKVHDHVSVLSGDGSSIGVKV